MKEEKEECPRCGGTGTGKNGKEVYCYCCGAILFITD